MALRMCPPKKVDFGNIWQSPLPKYDKLGQIFLCRYVEWFNIKKVGGTIFDFPFEDGDIRRQIWYTFRNFENCAILAKFGVP